MCSSNNDSKSIIFVFLQYTSLIVTFLYFIIWTTYLVYIVPSYGFLDNETILALTDTNTIETTVNVTSLQGINDNLNSRRLYTLQFFLLQINIIVGVILQFIILFILLDKYDPIVYQLHIFTTIVCSFYFIVKTIYLIIILDKCIEFWFCFDTNISAVRIPFIIDFIYTVISLAYSLGQVILNPLLRASSSTIKPKKN